MDKNGNKLFISMYHYTRDLKNSRYPNIKGMDITFFREQMKFFKENYNVIRMEQVMDAVEGKDDLPENALLLTFDDGYVDNYAYAFPILEDFGFQGSFFIPGKSFTTHQLLDVNKIHYIIASAEIGDLVQDVKIKIDYYRGQEFDYPSTRDLWDKYAVDERFDGKEVIFVKRILQTVLPEKVRSRIASDLFQKYVGVSEETLAYELYMTPEQIRTMKRHGMFIGVHGYDHYWLGNLSESEIKADINKGLSIMDEFIDRTRWVMNYPYGSYSDNVISFIKSKGAKVGLSTDVGVADLGTDDPFKLPRLDCNDFPPKSENYKEYLTED